LVAIVYTAIKTSRAIVQEGNMKPIFFSSLAFLIANLVLFLVYIPTLIYNPDINWKLKGEAEQDPMIQQAYVPPVFFCIALIILLLSALISKFVGDSKRRMRTT
jgi:hypothetical protein